jgi:hypothetical protein
MYCNQNQRQRSYWREFAFVLHLFQMAIEPIFTLSELMASRYDIFYSLAEPPRKRRYHVQRILS